MSFLGLVNYHRQFIPKFSDLAAPLHAVVSSKTTFVLGEKQGEAFGALKKALLQPPVLSVPNAEDPFILDTHASDQAVAAELLQVQQEGEKVIANGSYALSTEQRRYCTTRKELLAIVRFTRQFRAYLLGRQFKIRTDHASLVWLLNFKQPQGQLARWLEELSQFDMVIEHRAGRHHANADSLSRRPVGTFCGNYNGQANLQDLPCGGVYLLYQGI
ncbi:Pol polyprotein [Elysia marginata]|uniref:Pol polyprotein n=1 Tax=Elysia marginata TaxID=1093978 RepID=A0AAV4I3R2_9GAST|nr:Pol polyprotein [Elysia marginata]